MTSSQTKIAIYIPTYNAAQTLPLVLDRIPKEIKSRVREIFIVDNASTDNTYITAVSYKKSKGLSNLKILRNTTNRGYGGSQKRAYQYAIDKGFDIIVMLHGDAQYAPELIPRLLVPLEKGQADMVFGSRMRGDPLAGGMPIYRFLGNKLLTTIENFVLNLHLSEFHSGFRAYSVNALAKLSIDRCSNNYHFDTDILIQFKVANFRIREVPIPTHYGKESQSPTIKQLISYTLNILKSLSVYVLHVTRVKHSKKFSISRR